MPAALSLESSPTASAYSAQQPVLKVDGLRTEFKTGSSGSVVAVDNLSYQVHAGETLAIVGESGSGKSVSSLSIMGLLPDPPGKVTGGSACFEDKDLLKLGERGMQRLRGNRISMIFQEPMTSLNPVLSVGRQMTEGVIEHLGVSRAEAHARAVRMLARVHIPSPEARMREFPHQLSGGMLQRVMIAMALACEPKLLFADEPTTALDVTIQAQILDILRELRDATGTAIVLITHDMGVVAEMADRVIILYAGRKIEEGGIADIFERPQHPYTTGLLGALPVLGQAGPVGSHALNEIPGIVPALEDLPKGCHFAARCQHATPECRAVFPPFEEKLPGQWAACWQPHLAGGKGR